MTKLIYSLLFLLVSLASCQQSGKEQYSALVKKELDSKKKVNDVFFGISLGMKNKDFFTHCWTMNKQGIFSDGSGGGGTSVLYKLDKNELKYPAKMTFFPDFTDDKISNVWARFEYTGWMPWKKELGSDSLLPHVIELHKKWYPDGNSFITVHDEKKGTTAYIKVDGNRRILIRRYDDVDVKVDYTDLAVEKKEPKK
ncbi:MAG: hypothetical protein ABIR18_05370 [Chitinophagaceae bacterium]